MRTLGLLEDLIEDTGSDSKGPGRASAKETLR
jgi:hypothetical protein